MPRKIFVEEDSHGRKKFVIEKRGSSSRSSTAELLEASEQREASLSAENIALRNRLSIAERDTWEYQRLVNEHNQCRYMRAQLDAELRENRRLKDELDDEKDRVHKVTETLRRMRSYKEKYEEKWNEVEGLKRRILEQDDVLRLADTRIEDKNKVIIFLKKYLRDRVFYVE